MALRLKGVHEQIIVITGATSGIGLTTARLAAKRGAKMVLAARSEDALRQLVEEIRQAGGEAIYVVADVGDEGSVQTIAQAALRQFGHFDTWVNNGLFPYRGCTPPQSMP